MHRRVPPSFPQATRRFSRKSKPASEARGFAPASRASGEMLLLYWDIGRMILQRQNDEGWGAKVVDRLSADLRSAFPEHGGFSPRNLKYMRAFAAAWPEPEFVHRPGA